MSITERPFTPSSYVRLRCCIDLLSFLLNCFLALVGRDVCTSSMWGRHISIIFNALANEMKLYLLNTFLRACPARDAFTWAPCMPWITHFCPPPSNPAFSLRLPPCLRRNTCLLNLTDRPSVLNWTIGMVAACTSRRSPATLEFRKTDRTRIFKTLVESMVLYHMRYE